MSTLSLEDYRAKIKHVGETIYTAHHHLEIHEEMTDMWNERRPEYPKHFSWSRMAHYDAGVLYLTRVYDRNSLGLLKVIKLFRHHYASWSISNNSVEEEVSRSIEADISYLSDDPCVKSLKHLRNKTIAHTDNQLYPYRPSFDLEEIFGENLVFRDSELTTEAIDSLPPEEKKLRLAEANQKLLQALTKENSTTLGEKVPQFHELHSLSAKGLEICCRYMTAVGTNSISIEMSGSQIDITF